MPTPPPPASTALLAGLAGAVVMTVTHEVGRRVVPKAPRLDSLGRRAFGRALDAAGIRRPDGDVMQAVALVGDLASNTALFAAALAVGPPGSAPVRGLAVGAAAGLATLAAPPHLGIGPDPGRLAPTTRAMTVGLYVLGGLVAGLDYRRRLGRGGRGS